MTMKKEWPSYEDCMNLCPDLVKTCWLVWESMTINNEGPGREELWFLPDLREDMIARVKIGWNRVTGKPMNRFPYADWLIHYVFVVKVRKCSGELRPDRFQDAVGRPVNVPETVK